MTVALSAIQRDLGFSSSGLAWVVNAYLIAFGGLLLLAGRLGDLIGGKRVFLAGLAVFIVASLLCGVSVSQSMLLLGGFGLAFPAMIRLAMSGVPDSDAGVAPGLMSTTQQVGAALGVAVLSTLAAARTGHLLAAGRPAAGPLTGGYHVAFGTRAGLAAAALVLAAVALRPAGDRRRKESADQAEPDVSAVRVTP